MGTVRSSGLYKDFLKNKGKMELEKVAATTLKEICKEMSSVKSRQKQNQAF